MRDIHRRLAIWVGSAARVFAARPRSGLCQLPPLADARSLGGRFEFLAVCENPDSGTQTVEHALTPPR
jgi:hypothetical protein